MQRPSLVVDRWVLSGHSYLVLIGTDIIVVMILRSLFLVNYNPCIKSSNYMMAESLEKRNMEFISC